MRFSGRLQDWDEQRGFGFIRPLEGGDDVFVHGSALPSPRPSGQEVLSFEVTLDAKGRKKAVQVRRQAADTAALQVDRARDAQRTSIRQERGRERRGGGSAVLPKLLLSIAVVLLGGFGYQSHRQHSALQALQQETGEEGGAPPRPAAAGGSSGALVPSARFTCDGRTHCGQMQSCEEATFFLNNCPGTEMDGDGDGIPCEQQWCSGGVR